MDQADRILAHDSKVASLQWCPVRPASPPSPPPPHVLASAAFDFSIRLWNAHSGECFYVLTHHLAPIYSLDFAPDGRYLCSGSFDNSIAIWAVEVSTHVCIAFITNFAV